MSNRLSRQAVMAVGLQQCNASRIFRPGETACRTMSQPSSSRCWRFHTQGMPWKTVMMQADKEVLQGL